MIPPLRDPLLWCPACGMVPRSAWATVLRSRPVLVPDREQPAGYVTTLKHRCGAIVHVASGATIAATD